MIVKDIGCELGKIILIICLVVFFYNCVVNLYIYMCVPEFMSAFKLMLNMGSPLCLFLNKVQYELSNMYVYIWYISGTTLTYGMYSSVKKICNKSKQD